MFDGYQVIRFNNKIKPKDIGGLGVELEARKGSGNYDKERTQFNLEYVSLKENQSLASKVYSTLYNQKIHFNKSENTNILNGCIITSGPEFFKSLGLPMKPTGRKYVEGEHAGEEIFCPDIKSDKDIPEKVKDFFKDSYNFLSDIIGSKNIVYAAVHFDEDTPHMHFYFLPVVNETKRKVFETDNKGKRITKEHTDKNGITKQVPIQKRDENGKLVYKIEKGKFLDSDQFWKQLGGKSSFAKIQDDYNAFITSKGFNLDRGNIGSNRHHKDKALYNLDILKKEVNLLTKEIENNKKINEIELKTRDNLLNLKYDDVISPSKDNLKHYKEEDITKLINYTIEVKKDNIMSKNIIENQDITIKRQQLFIEEQKGIINSLKKEINSLNSRIRKMKNTFLSKINEAYLAVAKLLGFKYPVSPIKMEKQIDFINKNKNIKSKDNDLSL